MGITDSKFSETGSGRWVALGETPKPPATKQLCCLIRRSVGYSQSLSDRLMLALEHRALNRIASHRQMAVIANQLFASIPL